MVSKDFITETKNIPTVQPGHRDVCINEYVIDVNYAHVISHTCNMKPYI